MIRYHLRANAQRDLAEIWFQTADKWGVDQADHYVGAIRLRIEGLLDFPEVGPVVELEAGTFRKIASGHHLIFYVFADEVIEIVRVLHERMDVEGQLG